MIPRDAPFVLLDDARRSDASPARLYSHPVKCLTAKTAREVDDLWAQLRKAQTAGLHIAGYMHYELGSALLPHVRMRDAAAGLLAWFGIFERYQEINADAVTSWLPDPTGVWLSALQPQIKRCDYATAFAAVQEHIRNGDIYQANLTFRLEADFAGDPLALYAALRPKAAAGYGGLIWTGDQHFLSFSPELFFALKGRRITTKPMKGTAKRLNDSIADAEAAAELQSDAKQRAENLMIVDLLRNDLSRVCEPGSVEVPQLFHIESYPTVHQMTSTVRGELAHEYDAIDVIQALFPCGSITGAPKIRAMQIIDELEATPRGLYCGSIGRIDANGDAAFNVAIRTFSLSDGQSRLALGLGSGLVADSHEAAEWAECLAKGDFARMDGYGFDLIETMGFDPATGIVRLEYHLERMKESARALGFEFDRHQARNQLHAATFHLESPSKIRLLLSKLGAVAIEIRPAPQAAYQPWLVAVAPLPVDTSDYRLRHKTSDRKFYDLARKAHADCDEVVFVDSDGWLTEGSFSSIFVAKGDVLHTPPLARGLLPSVLRRELVETGKAVEADLTVSDLEGSFFVGNSLRGLIPAKRVA